MKSTEANTISAIPTEYGGVTFRSRMEAQCAMLFDKCDWKWVYEPRSFLLKNGVNYMPDFVVDSDIVVECRGYESEKGNEQIDGFTKEYRALGYRAFITIGPEKKAKYRAGYFSKLILSVAIGYCLGCLRLTFCAMDDEENAEGWPYCVRCSGLNPQYYQWLTVDHGKVLVDGHGCGEWEFNIAQSAAGCATTSLFEAIRDSGLKERSDGVAAAEVLHWFYRRSTSHDGSVDCSGLSDEGWALLDGLRALLQPQLKLVRNR